jgi:hypothetical protein
VGKAVIQSAEKVGNELQNVTTQLSKGPLESNVLEQLGESLGHLVFSGKARPSKEDFLEALYTVLPQYQQDMSTIPTDVKAHLERCFECATSKDDILNAINCGAALGALGGGLAAGPGGVLPGATFGAVSGAASKMGSLLLNKIIEEAKKNQIKRESRQTTTTAAS